MKIIVIAAAGKQGSLLVKEALSRGHEVTAVVRKEADRAKLPPQARLLVKDLFQLTYADLKEADAVIDAFGAWTPETLPQYSTGLRHLADTLSGKPNRLLVVGGAGSLYVDKDLKLRLLDAPDFPEIYKPVSTAAAAAFDELKVRKDVRWTYLCPPANFIADGARTGAYQAGGDVLLVNAAGKSEISYADYAIAMIDEAEKAGHVGRRFTVCSR